MSIIGINILQSAPDPLSVTAIIVAIISAIWSIISYIFRKNIDKKFQENLEKVKTENQKEIEQYKVKLTEQIETQKAEFLKEIEDLKAKNEKINYITKAQFDAEFKIYQDLSKFSFQLLLSTSCLFPEWDALPKDENEQQEIFKDRCKEAQENFMLFQNTLHKNAPFISKDLFELFENFRQENKLQINAYINVKFEADEECRKEYRKNIDENRKRTDSLMKMHEEITEKLREYLKSLKVIED